MFYTIKDKKTGKYINTTIHYGDICFILDNEPKIIYDHEIGIGDFLKKANEERANFFDINKEDLEVVKCKCIELESETAIEKQVEIAKLLKHKRVTLRQLDFILRCVVGYPLDFILLRYNDDIGIDKDKLTMDELKLILEWYKGEIEWKSQIV